MRLGATLKEHRISDLKAAMQTFLHSLSDRMGALPDLIGAMRD